MTITDVAPILAGQGRRRRRRPPLTGDTLPFFFFSNARDPLLHYLDLLIFQQQVPLSQVPRSTRHAAVDASHHRKDRRREPNSENRLSSRFFSYARDTPDPGAPPSHATPLRPRVGRSGTAATTPSPLVESTVGVNTFLCSKLQPAGGLSSLFFRLGLIGCDWLEKMRLERGFWFGAVLDCRGEVVILVFCFVFCLQDGVVLWCWGGVLRMGMLRDWNG